VEKQAVGVMPVAVFEGEFMRLQPLFVLPEVGRLGDIVRKFVLVLKCQF